MKRFLLYAAIGLVAVFGLVQLVPYRVDLGARRHAREPPESPRTRQLASAACFDCHSNDTATYWWEESHRRGSPLSW